MESPLPLVSIILPTFNGSRYIQQSIESCLLQSYKNLELIIVDDGSSDGTIEIINSNKDSRIAVIQHRQNQGLPQSLNTGFSRSKGIYLTWTSDDNYYHPSAIETMVNRLEEDQKIDFVYANYWQVNETNEVIEKVYVEIPEKLADYDCVGACFLYRRNVYERIGNYNYEMKPAEDYDYWLRAAKLFNFVPIDFFLYYYRIHQNSLTSQLGQIMAARMGEKAKLNTGWINYKQYKKNLAFLDICEAFENYTKKDYSNVRKLVPRAIVVDQSYLLNKGVLSIFFDSILGIQHRDLIHKKITIKNS